ncbi:hypothetical protein AB0D14_15125 [Streptomyces sp. NPDC048484]|uniref:hypothetical protein n=1 Tax=Streptomyces sp. NPDC048484 TaxID=3155146 RepID=UPI00343281AF
MRATTKTTSLLVGAALLGSAACGADSDSGPRETKKTPSADATGTGTGTGSETGQGRSGGQESEAGGTAKTLTKKQLDKAVLQGTVKGYKAGEVPAMDVPPQGGVSVDRAECAPIAYLISGQLSVRPKSVTYRSLKPADLKNATVGNVWLSSYDGDGVERVIADLDKAVDQCEKPFKVAGLTYRSVERVGSARNARVDFRVTGDISKQNITMNYAIVRSGNVVASFYGVNMLKPEKGLIPNSVVESQVGRLSHG